MIDTLVWDANLNMVTAHSWMRSTQKPHTAIGAIEETSTREKEGWPGLDKSDGRPKSVSDIVKGLILTLA